MAAMPSLTGKPATKKPDYQLADDRMQLGAYTQAIEQMYDIEIEQAHCAISIYEFEKGKGKRLKLWPRRH